MMLNILKRVLIVAALPFLASCGNAEKKKDTANAIDSNAKKECYVAIDGADTAYLDLRVAEIKVDGDLLIKYADKAHNKGTVSGKFSGDTLFVDYTFTVGEAKTPIYKNPLAFLKKDKQLILGVGVIETAYGRSYFVKDKPINFERGKFVFELGNCKDN